MLRIVFISKTVDVIAVDRLVENRIKIQMFHHINFSITWPMSIFAQKPYCRPRALALWKFCPHFQLAVLEWKFVFCFDASCLILSSIWSIFWKNPTEKKKTIFNNGCCSIISAKAIPICFSSSCKTPFRTIRFPIFRKFVLPGKFLMRCLRFSTWRK